MPLNSLRNSQPLRFSPAGLSDSLDETDLFPGACAVLTNLIPDPTTKNLWTCRPAGVDLTEFDSFTSPGFVSVFKVVGSLVYGMVASARFPGHDEPFCYDLVAAGFITVVGATSANTPISPLTVGDWTPPTMDLVGVNMVVTHPGFDGVDNFFGWFDTSNAATPVWHAGNLLGAGSIEALGAITGGALYVAGTYDNVPLTGGTGTGATARITVVAGEVNSVVLESFGAGYAVSDSLSASNTNIGGAGSGFAVSVAAVATGEIALTTVPTWVRQYNQRAWFGINPPTGQPSAVFTDVLVLTASNANQALTFGDNLKLIAACGLPLNNQLGGIIASLLVFKATSAIEQITGDQATSDLAVNTLNTATGTLSPRSICPTPNGLVFLAPDGMRTIDFAAHVGDPLGVAGTGVTVPFLSPLSPSRAAAACSENVLRVTVQVSSVVGTPFQEYWFDLVRKVWSGPHTLPCSMIDVYGGSFICAPQAQTAILLRSDTTPNFETSSVELGNQLQWTLQTAMLADNLQMAMSEITEMQVKTSRVFGMAGVTITALDQNGVALSTYFFAFDQNGSIWGVAIWGVDFWGGQGIGALYPIAVNFPIPVIYNRLAVQAAGACAQGFQIGDIFIRRRTLGYMQEFP